MNIIEVKDLNLWYGANQALKDVNISICANQVTALIGPSGCGKSTFLRTLNRMNDVIEEIHIEGSIIYGQKDIYEKTVDVNALRKEIGMVFQKPNPFAMSIYDNIAFGPRTHGITKKNDIDDLFMNTIGTVLGYLCWMLVDRLPGPSKEGVCGITENDGIILILLGCFSTFFFYNWRIFY